MSYSEFDMRMKSFEAASGCLETLARKTPVILRIDGCHFHTFTKGLEKLFDNKFFLRCMNETMLYLCENIQGCVLGYTQSDEISLVIIDYQKENTDAWFGYRIQKMCSVAASMAAMKFNQLLNKYAADFPYKPAVVKCAEAGAYFDCRAFSMPTFEVANYIYWRQSDSIRNSIQSIARSFYSAKQLQGVSCEEIVQKLKTERDIEIVYDDNGDYPRDLMAGRSCVKNELGKWMIDFDMPIIKNENRSYVEDRIMIKEQE